MRRHRLLLSALLSVLVVSAAPLAAQEPGGRSAVLVAQHERVAPSQGSPWDADRLYRALTVLGEQGPAGDRRVALGRGASLTDTVLAPRDCLLEAGPKGDFQALRTRDGLHRKCFVLSPGADPHVPLRPYPGAAGPILGPDGAPRTAASLTFYYVYDVHPRQGPPAHYLLGTSSACGSPVVHEYLLGWVEAAVVVPWDHRLGLEFAKDTFAARQVPWTADAPAAYSPPGTRIVGEGPGGVIFRDPGLQEPLAYESPTPSLSGSLMRWPVLETLEREGVPLHRIGFMGAVVAGRVTWEQSDQELLEAVGQIDVALVVDATGNVQRAFDRERERFIQQVLGLEERLGSGVDLRFALVAFDDYFTLQRPAERYDWGANPIVGHQDPIRHVVDFAPGAAGVADALTQLRDPGLSRNGADPHEAVFAGIAAALTRLSWRPRAQRVVVVIGESGDRPVALESPEPAANAFLAANREAVRGYGYPLALADLQGLLSRPEHRAVRICGVHLRTAEVTRRYEEYLRDPRVGQLDRSRQQIKYDASQALAEQLEGLGKASGGGFLRCSEQADAAALVGQLLDVAHRVEQVKGAAAARISQGGVKASVLAELSRQYGADVVALAQGFVDEFTTAASPLRCQIGYLPERIPGQRAAQVSTRVMISADEVRGIAAAVSSIVEGLRTHVHSETALRDHLGKTVLGEHDIGRRALTLAEVQRMTHGLPYHSELMTLPLDALVREPGKVAQLRARFERFLDHLDGLMLQLREINNRRLEVTRSDWRQQASSGRQLTWIPAELLP